MSLLSLVRRIVRALALFLFTLLEILGLPRIPSEKARKDGDPG